MFTKHSSVNYWPEARCAKAFWKQHELPPYQELLRDTANWLEPRAGERWLDLGCGSGRLSKLVWQKSAGLVAEIVGIDVADINEQAYAKLRATLEPRPNAEALHFLAVDFSPGLAAWADGSFDGIVSGLALQYAEHFDAATGSWTRTAYQNILAEARRLLKPDGVFVFSVNVPEPAWSVVAWAAVRGAFQARRPLHYLKKAWRICRYGNWVKREARRGRFHYLPLDEVRELLRVAGFGSVEVKTSFSNQAYLFRCRPFAAPVFRAA